MEKTVLSLQEYRAKCARYCAMAEHCESDVREKLYQWFCPANWMDEIVDYLYDNAYINEARYCAAFVHDKVAYQAWGRQKIRAALMARHLPTFEIEKALTDIDEAEYIRQLCHLIEKKKGTSREQLMRFLLQRGYTYEEILAQV